MEDVVRALGHLSLGTRMKRIGDRLQADTQALLDASGVGVPVAQHTVLAALDRLGPLTIGEISAAIGVRQPGVTRTVAKMATAGIVVASPTEDRRVKRVALTPAGDDLVAAAKADLWPRIEAAVQNACTGLSGSLLEQLAGLEDALADAPLVDRAGPGMR